MPSNEVPCIELEAARVGPPSTIPSPSPSEVSSASSPEPHHVHVTPLFRALTMPPLEPEQPPGQEELERRLPGYRRIVIPRDQTLIEMLRHSSGATTDEEVLRIREAKLRVVSERVGLRRLHVLAPFLRSLTLDGSAISSLRDLGIGLVHLKVLSINRCGLTNLDGVWGLEALRVLQVAGNPVKNLQPLAALQKLHTLDLAKTQVAEYSQVWMLAVCGSLRRLTLEGSPVSGEPDYRADVASALPMLIYLDDLPLHTDIEDEFIDMGNVSSSESEDEEEPCVRVDKPSAEAKPSTSKEDIQEKQHSDGDNVNELEGVVNRVQQLQRLKRRPATTESAGCRPRHHLPPRPSTAHGKPSVETPSRLHIMHTLMDEEWSASGSQLTSRSAFCGNFAQALRRPLSARKQEKEAQKRLIASGMEAAERAVAEEIPRAPRLEDWSRFKDNTGIDINIDFTRRPQGRDAQSAIERLERLEKETAERLANPDKCSEDHNSEVRANFTPVGSELWNLERDSFLTDNTNIWNMQFPTILPGTLPDLDSIFRDFGLGSTLEDSFPD